MGLYSGGGGGVGGPGPNELICHVKPTVIGLLRVFMHTVRQREVCGWGVCQLLLGPILHRLPAGFTWDICLGRRTTLWSNVYTCRVAILGPKQILSFLLDYETDMKKNAKLYFFKLCFEYDIIKKE